MIAILLCFLKTVILMEPGYFLLNAILLSELRCLQLCMGILGLVMGQNSVK